MKNILMILDNAYRPDVRVEKELATINSMGVNVDLYCWDKGSDLPKVSEGELLSIHRIKVPAKSQLGWKQIKNLVKFYVSFLKEYRKNPKNFDYIYVHDFLMLPLGVILKFELNIPLIYDAHEIYHLMEWEKYNSLTREIIFKTELFLLNYVNYFIVVNQIRKNFYSKYTKKNIIILGNWFDNYQSETVDIKKELGIPQESIVIGYFGTLSMKARNLEYLIESIKEIPDAHLVIAGVGHDEAVIEDISQKNKNIHFLGWQPDIRKYLNNIDYVYYCLNPDRMYFNYAAPNNLYVTISHKIPMITNVPGEPEYLISKYNVGYFIDTKKELCTQIDLDTKAASYKTKLSALNSISPNFNWQKSKDIYLQILNLN